MTYKPINWKDRIVEKPNTFETRDNGDNTVTLIPDPGQVLQEGTPLNAENLNHIEKGLIAAYSQLEQNKNDLSIKFGNSLNKLIPKYPITELLFEVESSTNFQGIESFGGFIYCGFDLGEGNGKINKYDRSGKLIDTTGSIAIGHTDSLSYRRKNSKLYIGAGGYNPFFVREYDWTTKTITREINLVSLGSSGLFTVDNDRDLFIVHTSLGSIRPHEFRIFDFDIKQIKHFTLENIGTPQNIYYYNNLIYFYTNNKITCIDLDGNIVSQFDVNNTGESEGMCVDIVNGQPCLILGWNSPNRIYKVVNPDYEFNKTFKALGSTNPRNNTAIITDSRTLCFSIKNNGGTWSLNNYILGFANDNLFESVTQTTNTVFVKLKQQLKSCEYVDASHDFNLLISDVRVGMVYNNTTNSFEIQFFKAGVRQDPATITNYSVVKCISYCSI